MDFPTILNVALGLVVLFFLLSTMASLLLELLTSAARYREEILFVTINSLLAGQPDIPWSIRRLALDRLGRRFENRRLLGPLTRRLKQEYQLAAPGRAAGEEAEDIVQRFWKHPKVQSLAAPGEIAPPAMEPATFSRALLDVVIPRDQAGTLPDNVFELSRTLARPQPGCPPQLLATLRRLAESGDISRTATGDAMWTAYGASVGSWFAEAMKRSTERYRKVMQYWLLGLGFVLALVLNADTVRTAYLLSKDRSLQEATAAYAATLVEENKPKETTTASGTREISAIRADLAKDIEHLRQLEAVGFPLGWGGPDRGFYNAGLYRKARSLLANWWNSDDSVAWAPIQAAGLLLLFALFKFAGLAATALAVAQGGPFWYDLMNKLVGLKKGQAGAGDDKAKDKTDGEKKDGAASAAAPVARPLEIGCDLAASGEGFSPRKAYWLARAAALAYAPEAEIRAHVVDGWKFHDCQFVDEKGTQAYCAYDDKIVLLVFRGTEPKELNDILTDIRVTLDPFTAPGAAATVHVHRGFQDALAAVDRQLQGNFGRWIKPADATRPPRRILLTGHSLGGALATLCFARLARTHAAARPLLYTFGCPKVGNEDFARELDLRHPGQIFRLVHETDVVPLLPPLATYHHTGQCRHFDGAILRSEVSGLSRLLAYAAGAAKDLKSAGQKAVDDHGMNHYVTRCEALAKTAV